MEETSLLPWRKGGREGFKNVFSKPQSVTGYEVGVFIRYVTKVIQLSIEGMIKIRYDRIGGVIWMALGAALAIGSIKLGLGALHKPGSGLMPFLTGILLGSLGLLLTLLDTRKRSDEKGDEEVSLRQFWGMGACSLAASFLYAFLLSPLGFIVATFLLFLSLFKIMGTRKWFTPILISLLAVSVSYFIFDVWLRIEFPRGILTIR